MIKEDTRTEKKEENTTTRHNAQDGYVAASFVVVVVKPLLRVYFLHKTTKLQANKVPRKVELYSNTSHRTKDTTQARDATTLRRCRRRYSQRHRRVSDIVVVDVRGRRRQRRRHATL